jgi:transposase
MIHWAGIAAYRKPENSLASSRGSTIKSESANPRACGLRDEEYLRLEVLTCTLPML